MFSIDEPYGVVRRIAPSPCRSSVMVEPVMRGMREGRPAQWRGPGTGSSGSHRRASLRTAGRDNVNTGSEHSNADRNPCPGATGATCKKTAWSRRSRAVVP
ncbi:hypothetical protein BVI434_2780002 [Burkholderia vietnamiensis]|nr:hypothetical protein BVI434_2780002 [Burkholderia vietnamiensis]